MKNIKISDATLGFKENTFSFKETLLFNIVTIIICFLVAIIDPLYTILYVVPTLIVGDLFEFCYSIKEIR